MIEGPAILMIQKVLASLGYKVFLDGVLGQQTLGALVAFGKKTLLKSAIHRVTIELEKHLSKSNKKKNEENLLKQILEAGDAKEAEKLIKRYKENQKIQRKKIATKTRRQKKEKTVTATDTVLNLIKRSKGGITTEALSKETEFDKKKIQNIVYRLKKQKKIKNLGRGIYGAA